MQTDSEYSSNGDRLLSTTDTMRNKTTYSYDTANSNDLRVKSVTQNGATVNYAYVPNTTLVSEVSASVTGLDGVKRTVSNSYAYEKDRLKSITHNGFSYHFTYDGYGNRLTTKVGSRTLNTNQYESGNGRLIKSTYGNGAVVENVYDRYDRVTSKKYDGVERYRYVYDAARPSCLQGKAYSVWKNDLTVKWPHSILLKKMKRRWLYGYPNLYEGIG